MSLLNSHPLLTKAVTSGLITAAGDIGCQTLVEKKEKFDFKRFFMFSGLGLVLVGPTLHVWYGALNKFIPAQTTAGALYRCTSDQTVFAGPSYCNCYILPVSVRRSIRRDTRYVVQRLVVGCEIELVAVDSRKFYQLSIHCTKISGFVCQCCSCTVEHIFKLGNALNELKGVCAAFPCVCYFNGTFTKYIYVYILCN